MSFTNLVIQPPIIAHRGASLYAPENTLAAFRKAKTLGINWVEFDVMLSADDEPIIIHDETLERTTNGKGKVSRRKFLASSTALASAVGALSGVGSAQQGQESARSVSDRARAIRVRLTWHLMCRTLVPSGRPPPMRERCRRLSIRFRFRTSAFTREDGLAR